MLDEFYFIFRFRTTNFLLLLSRILTSALAVRSTTTRNQTKMTSFIGKTFSALTVA